MSEPNVSFGVPLYMKEYWDFMQKMYPRTCDIKLNDSMAYNHGRPNQALVEEIKKLHKYVGNAETSGYTVIVGNGASQIVSAVGYALSKARINNVLLVPPFWGRLKFLLNAGFNAAGDFGNAVRHAKSDITGPWVRFATSPNNPDAREESPEGEFKVVDMCYSWPQYTKKIERSTHDVMIFGLSKATGHAGTRIGWALVKDPDMAENMRLYIHMSTCGISNDAQARAISIIGSILSAEKNSIPSCFQFGKEKLAKRWKEFKFVSTKIDEIKVLNSSGMFAWCQLPGEVRPGIDPQMWHNVRVSPGHDFGMPWPDTRFIRINLGCSDEDFKNLMGVLRDGSKTTQPGA